MTAAEAKISWRVQVANLKAGWYKFLFPMDLPSDKVQPTERRNANIAGAQRALLDIRPSSKSIAGTDEEGLQYRFDDGTFFGGSVYLGEIRTDPAGRLVFLGGFGTAQPLIAGDKPKTFANNDGWHDDVCDGPVRATVTIDGVHLEASPAISSWRRPTMRRDFSASLQWTTSCAIFL
ncbi:hypothetical protein AJ88_15795 [Mesorhizobium amorphae CCBAU 01583]|nr:hypothetical protein AJ88_15795 [Mesorhizobium amorphae CCBAU 01583]